MRDGRDSRDTPDLRGPRDNDEASGTPGMQDASDTNQARVDCDVPDTRDIHDTRDAPAVPRRNDGERPPARRQWQSGDAFHIDVRGLPPPQPLVAILRLVQSMADDARVVVHHDRDPQLLYPELAEIGWQAERVPGEPGEVRLLLRRRP